MVPELVVVAGAVALPFAAAGTAPLLSRFLEERFGYVGAAVALTSFLLLASQYDAHGVVSVAWVPSLSVGLRFFVDGWSLLFGLLATGIGVLVFAYSATYMHGEPRLGRYHAALLAFMGSIVGVALSADLVMMFLFWELTSICSFILIGHYRDDPASQYAARMAMVVTVGGALFMLVGFIVLAFAAGNTFGAESFDLAAMLNGSDEMRTALRELGLFTPALLLVATGIAAKSAQVPLHFWLPNAMEAPTPVSAYLHSATMVKLGVYLAGRLRPLLLSSEWTLLFTTIGLVTMTVAAALAITSTDIKELLAYSTASHLGLMIAAFGFEPVFGAEAGVFHLFNHGLFKATLFLVAGIVAHGTGTRRLANLGGLGRAMPVTAVITGIAALGMAGIPPFNGFYSKELFFEAAYEVGHSAGGLAWLYPATAVFAAALTVVYSLQFLSMFFGEQPDVLEHVHRPPAGLLVPPAILAAAAAVVGVAPEAVVDVIVQAAADATTVETHTMHAGLPTSLTPPFLMTGLSIGLGIVLYTAAGLIQRSIREVFAEIPPAQPNWWYNHVINGFVQVGELTSLRMHNGLLRTYTAWVIGATSVFAVAGFAATPTNIPAVQGLDSSIPIVLVLTVAVIAGIAIAITTSYVAGVLTLSILGFMIAIFYILASAPDLALTQLVVETLALVIFLLVLEKLPREHSEWETNRLVRDVTLSAFVGVTVFLVTVLSIGDTVTPTTEIAQYYTEQAVSVGGGTNIVNVILVDFRNFDTIGEIVVLAIAALSVLTLVATRDQGENE